MPPKKRSDVDKTPEILTKMLVFQLHAAGVAQERISKIVGRQTAWVNDLLKGLPKGGSTDGREAKAKKASRGPRRNGAS
jgi:hypothetical protein